MDLNQAAADFSKKYSGTFARIVTSKGDYIPCEIVDVDLELTTPTVCLYALNFGKLYIQYGSEEFDFDFTFPTLGYMDYDGFAVYVHRSFERQWKRGFCNGTVRTLNPLIVFGSAKPRISFDMYCKLWTQVCRPMALASELLTKGSRLQSVTVAPDWMLSLSPQLGSMEHIVWYRNLPIATYWNNALVIKEKLFEQEIMDYIKESGDTVWLV
jgi:hypothetical protein